MAKRLREISSGRIYFDAGVDDPKQIVVVQHADANMGEYIPNGNVSAVTLNFSNNEGEVPKPFVIMDPETETVVIKNLHLSGRLTGIPTSDTGSFLFIEADRGEIDDLIVKTLRVKDYSLTNKGAFGSLAGALTVEVSGEFAGAGGPAAPLQILHDTSAGMPDNIGVVGPEGLMGAHLLVGKVTDGIGIDRNQIAKVNGNLILETEDGSGHYLKAGGRKLAKVAENGELRIYNARPGDYPRSSWDNATVDSPMYDAFFEEWKQVHSNGSNSSWIFNYGISGRLYFENETAADADDPLLVSAGRTAIAYIEGRTEKGATWAAQDLLSFTGQHRCLPATGETLQGLRSHIGKIVVSAGEIKADIHEFRDSRIGPVGDVKRKVSINNARPKVKLSSVSKQKSVFGIISNFEDSSEVTREYRLGAFVTVSDKDGAEDHRVIVNSLGEGGIWVCNVSGNLENGDYITTSNIAGYGMKQDDDILHNYTVAKITMDCNFDLSPTDAAEELEKKEEIFEEESQLATTAAEDKDIANAVYQQTVSLGGDTSLAQSDLTAKTAEYADRIVKLKEAKAVRDDAKEGLASAQEDYDCRILTSEESVATASSAVPAAHAAGPTPVYKSTGKTSKTGKTTGTTSDVRIAFVSCTYHCG